MSPTLAAPIFAASSVAMVGFVTHAAAALAYLALTLLLVARGRGRGIGLVFLGCLVLTIAWAGVTAWDALDAGGAGGAASLLDVLRVGGWLGFLTVLLWPALDRRGRGVTVAAIGGLMAVNLATLGVDQGWIPLPATMTPGDAVGLTARLALPVGGLLLIENLVRNGSRAGVWSGKFLFLALGAMWAYDLFVDAHALLYRVAALDLRAPRGAIQVLIMPLLAVAAARNATWSLDIGISRGAVFHSAALVGSGLFLLLMACAGYYLREFGGSWGPLLQVTFLAAACTLVAIVITVGTGARPTPRVHQQALLQLQVRLPPGVAPVHRHAGRFGPRRTAARTRDRSGRRHHGQPRRRDLVAGTRRLGVRAGGGVELSRRLGG
jgi:hypothetical protein